LRQVFGYAEQPNFPPRFNVAPTQPVPVIIIENGVRHFRLMRWGFLPAWIKDPRQFSLVINARSETVLEKPAFKNAIKRRRCLIPADGYYEWHTSDNRKRPYFIHRRDGQPVGFTVSIGIAESSGCADLPSLLARADLAMYEAKRAGGGCWRAFEGTGQVPDAVPAP